MSKQPESEAEQQPHENTVERAAERDGPAAPDAPTSGEEHEGMSTILSAETLSGVQRDAGEE